MARQLSFRSMGLRPCGAIAQRQYFPYKMQWIVDEMHLQGIMADCTPRPRCTYIRATWPPRGRGRGESLCSPRRIEAKLRAVQALELWQAGATWEAIAHQLGYSDKSGAWRAVRRLFDRLDYDRWLRQEAQRYQ